MDANDLRVFEAVARLRGMSRAAAELHTVQSNVTARIRALEDELGTALFVRHSRGVELTGAGRRLLPYAARVRHLLEDARRAAVDEGRPRGPLTVGSLETTAGARLAPALASFAAAYPEVDLVLATGTTAELVEAVRDQRLEGAFVCGPVSHPDLLEEPAYRETLVVVTPPDIGSLADLPGRADLKVVVLRAGCSYRERLEGILAARGVAGLRRLESGTIEGVIGCVAAGLGVSLLPRSVAEPARRDGRLGLHELAPGESGVETVFVRRRDGFVSSALSAFLAHARPPEQIAAIT